MPNLMRKAVVLCKEESVYGQDPTPGAVNGLLVSPPEPGFSGDRVKRNFVRSTLSPAGDVVGIKRQTLRFSTELKGGNDPEDPAKETHFDCLLKSCAMKPFVVLRLPISSPSGTFAVGEIITGGTSSAYGTLVRATDTVLELRDVDGTFEAAETVTGGTSTETATVGNDPMDDETREYRPTSALADMKSSTIYYYADAIRHKLLGCEGNLVMNFPVGEYPTLEFNMTAMWKDPTDNSPDPDLVFEEHLPPRCLLANLKIGDYTPIAVNAISMDLGNQVAERKDINSEEGLTGLFIPTRDPSGSIDPEVDTLANFDPFAVWKAGTKVPISWKIGSDLGNRAAVYVPAAQIGDISYQDRDGIRVYSLPIRPTGTDDEICIQIG